MGWVAESHGAFGPRSVVGCVSLPTPRACLGPLEPPPPHTIQLQSCKGSVSLARSCAVAGVVWVWGCFP